MLSFQEIITTLQNFWMKKGCLLTQSYEIEAGAGTFHPETFLRCLGPEPYNVVGTAISKRPTDGRYGLNPNRLQRFHQLQVIMKPSPDDFQALYLESLESIGLSIKDHDIRFVHDDWESPTQGAWGLGWEVWCDGMEITQFTYFQSVGGQSLSPIASEIAYGVERICMFLQGKSSVYDMHYSNTHSYGQIFLESEKQACHYNFEEANVAMWQSFFDAYEKEALTLLTKGLTIPAYDFAIKASHAFNMLDARGAISITQRVDLMHRIKKLCTQTAVGYIEERQKLDFPLLDKESITPEPTLEIENPTPYDIDATDDLLLEIGSEEIPATYTASALISFKRKLEELLNKLELSFDGVQYFTTQRRLAAHVKNLSCSSRQEIIEKKGPPIERIYDEDGLVNRQGLGFFQAANLDPLHQSELTQDSTQDAYEMNGYLYVKIKKEAKSTLYLLQKELPLLISKVAFPKSMRWNNYTETYARPIRWLVALLGKKTIHFNYAGISSSNITYGHKQLYDYPIVLTKAKNYEKKLEKGYVLADPKKRKAHLQKQLEGIKQKLAAIAINEEELIEEILFLSEYPTLAIAEFGQEFLTLPKELLVSEMHDHQRYFPLEKEGFLMNTFVIAVDKKPTPLILKNNERVLKARLCDAEFLLKKDQDSTLEELNTKLGQVTFHKDLGSMQEKMQRIKELTQTLAKSLKLTYNKEILNILKADLTSQIVCEFTELQGVIGKYLAIHAGFKLDEAMAIQEHYMPTSEGSILPSSDSGLLFSLADKLDNLISYTKIGIKASASKDPYALRRSAIGVLRILVEKGLNLDLAALCKTQEVPELLAFFKARLPALFKEYGFDAVEIQNVASTNTFDPHDLFLRAKAIHEIRQESETFDELIELIKRLKGQIKGQAIHAIEPKLLQESQEKELYNLIKETKIQIESALQEKRYEAAIKALVILKDPIASFFDNIRINCDDEKLKKNRTALLQEIYASAQTIIIV